MYKFILLTVATSFVLIGCDQTTAVSTKNVVDQENICEVKGWQHDVTANSCRKGQKILFLPDRWGNEQLPVLFAAVNCDLRYSVVLTQGAVTCIYAPIKPNQQEQSEDSSNK